MPLITYVTPSLPSVVLGVWLCVSASYVYTNLAITSGQDDDKFQEYDVKKGHFDGKHFFVQKKKGKHEESEVLFSYPMPGEDKDDKSRPAISGVEFPIE